MKCVEMPKRAFYDGGAGRRALAALRRPWVERFRLVGTRIIPVARTRLSLGDLFGTVKVRWDLGRRSYRVTPGLYAVGSPGPESDVFVTANYKYSYDALRSSLDGLDAWMLVLDTKGVNVWCAAGKGSFGTKELVARIAKAELASLVSHRRIVLPQLGATGVAAFEVARQTGFKVEWGPVRARDIKAWLQNGRKKDERMREVTFNLRDRLAVAPVELVHGWPILPGAALLAALYALPADAGFTSRALPMFTLLAGSWPLGALLFPLLLPFLPSRAFSIKGATLGLAWALAAGVLFHLPIGGIVAAALVATPVTAFVAMNFTGSSTYTCQPGASLEVELSFWPMIVSLGAGIGAGVLSRIAGA